ncbi:MAG TPA: hypothetical protein QF753_04205 [Victivallales bacterium]|nr:hypothetical protein [Victivallales bacterium]
MIDNKTELQKILEMEVNALLESPDIDEKNCIRHTREMNWKKNSELNYYFNTADFSIPSNYSCF